MLPLYSLFAARARTDLLYHHSLRASLDAALVLTSTEKGKDYKHLTTMGGGPSMEGFRCAATTICVETLAHVDTHKRDGTRHSTAAAPVALTA